MPDSAQDDKIVDRCLNRPGAKQAREPPVGRASSLNSSAESKYVLGTSPLAHAADEGDVHSRVSATSCIHMKNHLKNPDVHASSARCNASRHARMRAKMRRDLLQLSSSEARAQRNSLTSLFELCHRRFFPQRFVHCSSSVDSWPCAHI
eukprot:jgi/Bigna1/58966/fgenesh1_kg.2_\